MTRSLTLIKLYFVDSLRVLHNEIKEKLKLRNLPGPIPDNLQLSLFYGKFKTLAAKAGNLLREIEMRCAGHPEYNNLLSDCIQAYLNVRKALLFNIIADNIRMKHENANMIQFVNDFNEGDRWNHVCT
jgi:hypothetical protein